MANFFQKLFGGGKKQEAVATYFPSQDPRYQRAQKELEDLLSRRGYFNESEMGYTPSMISSTTAPYATARRENFKNYEVPLISAQASARGLGRSTIPVNRIALSGQEAERDIQNKIAELVTQSEQLKGSQKAINAQVYQNAIQGETGLATQETAAQQAARQRAADAQEANRLQDIATTQNAGIFGTQAAGPILSGIAPFLSLIPGVGPALSVGATALGGVASSIGSNTRNSALVNKGDDELMTMLKNLFAGKGMPSSIGGSLGYRTS